MCGASERKLQITSATEIRSRKHKLACGFAGWVRRHCSAGVRASGIKHSSGPVSTKTAKPSTRPPERISLAFVLHRSFNDANNLCLYPRV